AAGGRERTRARRDCLGSRRVGHGRPQQPCMSEREGFIGYQELALLATRPEYRSPVEIIAEDATSEWIEVQSAGEDKNKSDVIKQIEDDLVRFDVRTV